MNVFQWRCNWVKVVYRYLTSPATGLWLGFSFAMPTQAMALSDLATMLPPDSQIIEAKVITTIRYHLPLGAMRKVNGVIGAENSRQLQGQLERITWKIAPDYTAHDVHNQLIQQLQSSGARLLFTCQGRACGSSNQWANNTFRQAILYGIDRQQVYAALAIEVDSKQYHYAIYATRRGNRKVYLHADIISESESSIARADSALKPVLIQPFQGNQLEPKHWTANLAQLKAYLVEGQITKLYLVGQSNLGTDLAQQIEQGTRLARQVAEALQTEAIDLTIETLSVGPFGLPESAAQQQGRVLLMPQ
mgnify:CR=1 FL=1